MKGRVKLDRKGIITTAMDWKIFVENPSKDGYWIEAFASADALIDSNLESLLRQIYNSVESQHLISKLDSVKEETKFFGSGILKILERVGVINKKLGGKIRAFKGKRNKVSHTIYGEYALVDSTQFKTQEEFDFAVENESRKSLEDAKEIWMELIEIAKRLHKKFQEMDSNDKIMWLVNKEKDF